MAYSIKVNSVTATKVRKGTIKSSLTKFAGSFKAEVRDAAGTYSVLNGHEFELYDGVTKRFGGYVKKRERGKGMIIFNGYDYTSKFAKIYVNELYNNTLIHSIISDLLTKYAPDITDTNVYTSTVAPEEVRLKNVTLFKALQKLAEYENAQFYVDEDKDLHFGILGQTSSGITLTKGSNILTDKYTYIDDKLINKVRVTGGREDYRKTETKTGDNSTTEFGLARKPLDGRVTLDGVEQVGFKKGMTGTYDYSWDKENKKCVFQTAPGSGVAIVIEFSYSSPVIIDSQDGSSMGSHGTYEKVIYDDTINNKADAQRLAAKILLEASEPTQIGTVTTRLNFTAQVGQTVDVINASKDVNDTFIILSMEHALWGAGFKTTYTLATYSESIVDILSDVIRRVEALEEEQRGEVDVISYLRSFVDEVTADDDPANNLTARTRTVNKIDTWYFATPHQFSEPIKFGGGSGKYGSNVIQNPSS